MKKIIIGVAILAAIVSGVWLSLSSTKPPMSADEFYAPSEENGFIPEKTVGDLDKAKLIIYEYADFGCSHCADWNQTLNDLMKKYDGKIALVFRNYDLGFKNGSAAAKAATAAGIQGYFGKYKDLLFENQVEWFDEDGAVSEKIFSDYLRKASDNLGDVEKFRMDMESDSVKKHLDFEQRLGKAINLKGTPTFRINGETIKATELTKTIEDILGK